MTFAAKLRAICGIRTGLLPQEPLELNSRLRRFVTNQPFRCERAGLGYKMDQLPAFCQSVGASKP